MTKSCLIPNCKTGYKSVTMKRSMFKVPAADTLRQKWQSAIAAAFPNLRALQSSQFVCERHFKPSSILRKYVKHDLNGKLIAEVLYKHPKLELDTVPNIFIDEVHTLKLCTGQDVLMEHTINPLVNMKQSEESIEMDLPQENDQLMMDVATNGMTGNEDRNLNPLLQQEDLLCQASPDNYLIESSKVPTLRVINTGCVGDEKNSIMLPESWSISQSNVKLGTEITFCLIIRSTDNNAKNVVVKKYIVVENWSGHMEYYVYGKRVSIDESYLPPILNDVLLLPVVLNKFEKMRVCKGAGSLDSSFIKNDAFEDGSYSWHHNQCSLVTKKNKCDNCKALKKIVWQRLHRTTKNAATQRVSRVLNPQDEKKLNALRKKLKEQRRRNNRARLEVIKLKEALQEKQAEVAALNLETFAEKCSELKIPEPQQIALKEIIAAAKSKPNGRRYSENWLMLCMLMNIRSPSNYEFLRKNKIIALPCTRTLRNYYSMIDTKCGFDASFGQLLNKHFATKKPMQRHGLLLLDEINLRKSVTVSAKNLTYTGLTDFGDDGPSATGIDDQATHGLVLMFQPLADTYTQPIAVFASKNPVKGDELAKLVVKGISFLENCGAMVHGVISDGASTNKKMARLLGISGSLDETKTWFRHPLNNERRVFVFSDVPHVVKNIRNRLFNKHRLRLNARSKYIEWRHYDTLLKLDSEHEGHARVCPKLSTRHVVLDNTAKMRVRLATQIFSNSVATGLKYYLMHNPDELRGCEETANFSKMINDMFDALNRKVSNQGVRPDSPDFKILEASPEWLNEWERAMKRKEITAAEFLTAETAEGLRLSLQSSMDLCRYLIDNYQFQYLLTGKVNQDNLEKFFGTIRQAAGCNDHPNCSTFLQLYKILSVYSIIKPPKAGNCTVTDSSAPKMLVTISDLEEIFGSKSSNFAERRQRLKEQLDKIIRDEEWEAIDVIESEHDYSLTPVLDCIIYYVTGYLSKQVLKRYDSCPACCDAILRSQENSTSVSLLVELRSRGGLIHSNLRFFNLIRFVESCFAKHATTVNVFDLTMDEVICNYDFTFPCKDHAADILSYSICYYIRLRMRQFCYQENQQLKKRFVTQKKLSKLTNQ